jgi:hypothetical protein
MKSCRENARSGIEYSHYKLDAAGLIVQALGEVPTTCDETSGLQSAYNFCKSCIEENSQSQKTIRDYIEPEFVQYFNWCESQFLTSSATPAPSASTGSLFTTTSAETSRPLVVLTWTGYDCDIRTAEIAEDLLSAWAKTKAGFPPPPPTATTSTKLPSSDEDPPTKSWIAGPVVGSVAVVVLLDGLGVWLYRRKYKKRPELQSEEGVPELDPREPPAQLESTEIPKPTPELVGSEAQEGAEMPANEPAGQEMEATMVFEKGPSDVPRIKKTPLNPECLE